MAVTSCRNDDFNCGSPPRSSSQVIRDPKKTFGPDSSRRNGTIRRRRRDRTLRRRVVPADALGDFDFVAYAEDRTGGPGAGVLAEDGFICVEG